MDRIATLTELLQKNPTDTFARYGLAMAYAAAGQTAEALREFATTIENNPDYVPAYQMAAQTLLKQGETATAKTRLIEGVAAAGRTGNTHAASEMQAMLDDLTS